MCLFCNGVLEEENVLISVILDIKINVIKQYNYKHLECNVNDKLPRGVTYGSNIKAT